MEPENVFRLNHPDTDRQMLHARSHTWKSKQATIDTGGVCKGNRCQSTTKTVIPPCFGMTVVNNNQLHGLCVTRREQSKRSKHKKMVERRMLAVLIPVTYMHVLKLVHEYIPLLC